MPKTREQKHKEALERLRDRIPAQRVLMMRAQRGGDLWKAAAVAESEKNADYLADVSRKTFERLCQQAKVTIITASDANTLCS